jgi:hypothetical protein
VECSLRDGEENCAEVNFELVERLDITTGCRRSVPCSHTSLGKRSFTLPIKAVGTKGFWMKYHP